MDDFPAILGGKAKFEALVPMVRPALPEFSELASDIESILVSGMVTKGRYLREFEQAVAKHLGVRHTVAVSSCTSGLMLVYKGLGLQGEVIAPSFTFMATVSALEWNGLRPVFVDVDPRTTNLDPAAVRAAITQQTSAIVAVHNFGNPAAISELEAIAREKNLKLIFDAAHGFGARFQGTPVGGQGDAQVFSLSPTKLLIAGEGGIVATNSDELAEFLRMGREYGNNGSYDSAFAGLNARMPELSALLGLRHLPYLEAAAESRNDTAALFQEAMGRLPGISFQEVRYGDRNSYREFSIMVDAEAFGLTRDELADALAAENVDTRKYYDPPVHRHTAYRQYADGMALPNTDYLAASSLSFPMWTNMDESVALGICEAMEKIHLHAPAVRERLEVRSPG